MKMMKLRFVAFVMIVGWLFSIPQNFIYGQDENFIPKIVVWSPDGTMVAIGGEPINCDENIPNPDRVRIFDPSTQEVAYFVPNIGCGVLALDWSPDSTKLVMSDMRQGIRIWDITTQQFTPNIRISQSIGVLRPVSWNPDGSTIVVVRGDSRIILLDALTGEIIGDIDINGIGGEAANWSQDGTRLFVSSQGELIDYDFLNEVASNSLDYDSGLLLDVNSSQDDEIVAVYDIFQMIRIVDATKWESVLDIPTGYLTDIDLNPDGSQVVGVGPLPGLSIWDISTGDLLTHIEEDGIYGVAWSPDGSQIVYVGEIPDGVVFLNALLDNNDTDGD